MFTESDRVISIFLACRSGSANNQTFLIFHGPYTTLYPNCGSANLEYILSWISTACWVHFQSCPVLLPSCLEKLAVLSWFSTKTPPLHRLIALTDHTDRPVINTTNVTWTLNTESLPVGNRQAGNCVGQVSFIFMAHSLSVNEICGYIMQVM